MDRNCQCTFNMSLRPSLSLCTMLTLQSGIFRPEMLEPMGIPKNVRVLGWGMSCERPTMIK